MGTEWVTYQRAEEPYGLLLYRKKRIRKDFGKRDQVLDTPYLLSIQLDSSSSSSRLTRKVSTALSRLP